MASTKTFMMIIVIVAVLAPLISATEHVVGEDKGWTPNFNYGEWVSGKQFYVGDKLVFKYSPGAHTVTKVNGTGFQQCSAPDSSEAFTTGNDVIPLSTPGKKWYICTVAKHCASGNQRLAITVLPRSESPSSSPTPSPTSPSGPGPASAAITTVATTYCGLIVAAVGVLGLFMV